LRLSRDESQLLKPRCPFADYGTAKACLRQTGRALTENQGIRILRSSEQMQILALLGMTRKNALSASYKARRTSTNR
jgi:hypothetical protein